MCKIHGKMCKIHRIWGYGTKLPPRRDMELSLRKVAIATHFLSHGMGFDRKQKNRFLQKKNLRQKEQISR